MSILFGILRERGTRIRAAELKELSAATAQYATGAPSLQLQDHVGMGAQPYSTHERSTLETGPLEDPHGNILSFDGRLDNFQELAAMLDLDGAENSDSAIVLAAFLRWNEECFARLTGDWALSLWCKKTQTLFLARDHAGTRTLYFSRTGPSVIWATYLDTLTACREDHELSAEYAWRYLACFPIRDATPFRKMHAVPPGAYLAVRSEKIISARHWSPYPQGSIRYGHDRDYEERFLDLFAQAVKRRTGKGAPILAELSGGMDSTSIVCMSDFLRRAEMPDAELLDTISFYDDSEPSLNERAYFSITESKRGKIGTHVDTAFSRRTFAPPDLRCGLYLFPGADSLSLQMEMELGATVWSKGYRSVLSGIGGDEVLGGNPIGEPELSDYLISMRFLKLLRGAVAWSLVDRSPLVGTLGSVARFTKRVYWRHDASGRQPPPWLAPNTPGTTEEGIPGFRSYGGWATPSAIDNALSWQSIMESLPHLLPPLLHRPEYRYPFLDKDLVNYLFAIPREQILRPGQRRSLMRRSLAGILPIEILERRQKAYQLRAPLKALRVAYEPIRMLFKDPLLAQLGFVDLTKLRTSVDQIREGSAEGWQALVRAIAFEIWLRTLPSSSFKLMSSEEPFTGLTASGGRQAPYSPVERRREGNGYFAPTRGHHHALHSTENHSNLPGRVGHPERQGLPQQ